MTDHLCDHATVCREPAWTCPHKAPHPPVIYAADRFGTQSCTGTANECFLGGFAAVRCVPVEGKE